jgi:CheY-like chemotaxis protein
MESIGLLAGGVAHDFNNLLTVVLGNVELLLNTNELAEEARSTVEIIRRAAQRAAVLVSQLLAFSRRQVMVPRVLDLNSVVSEVQPFLGRLIGEHIDLVADLYTRPLPVRADPTQLQQVLINLATNARDAMAAGGTLTIKTEYYETAPAGTIVPAGRYACLAVRDTGIGMDAQTKRMIFHPFFTTKDVGRGTRLGLATVHGIIQQSEGYILVESEPGQGTCFRIFLPWVPGDFQESTATPAVTAFTADPGPATVLVAEDESEVRALTARTLEAAGFTVIEAENGEQALEVSRRHEGPIDLLMSDVLMPKMGGIDLANRLSEERPGIRILLVSGYSPDQTMAADDPSRVTGFLQKPFTSTELVSKASKLLVTQAASQHASSAGNRIAD